MWLGDLPVAVLQPSGQFYIAPDHLGSPHQIADASGALVWFWDHDPFGVGVPSGTFGYNLRFPGQFFDQRAKLHYNYFRDYDPNTGRYIESDPIGLAGGINTYAYAGGNPLTFADPFGLSSVVFDRNSGTITIYDNQGNQVGQYPIGNNTTSTSNGPFPDGTYNYSYYEPHPESGPNGPYGSNGNFSFDVPGRTGMGIHGGRNEPQSRTLGCIRTTDEATQFLNGLNSTDPLQTLTVQ